MSNFFDNFCRTLATPMPRSRALKLIAGGLAVVVMAPFAFGQNNKCKPGTSVCGGAKGGCCSPGQTCYGNATSTTASICCGAGLFGAFCTNKNKTNLICVTRDASGNYPTGCVHA